MRHFRRGHSVCGVVLFLLCMAISSAQEFRATLNGRITDATGAPVPAARVVARNIATNAESAAETNEEGVYTIPSLAPGPYEVIVEATGFKRVVRQNIQLQVSETRTVDIPVEIGQVTEQITVSAAPPLLEETTATRGGVIENIRVTELPLNGRNPFMLAGLNPGVQFAGNPIFTRPPASSTQLGWGGSSHGL